MKGLGHYSRHTISCATRRFDTARRPPGPSQMTATTADCEMRHCGPKDFDRAAVLRTARSSQSQLLAQDKHERLGRSSPPGMAADASAAPLRLLQIQLPRMSSRNRRCCPRTKCYLYTADRSADRRVRQACGRVQSAGERRLTQINIICQKGAPEQARQRA